MTLLITGVTRHETVASVGTCAEIQDIYIRSTERNRESDFESSLLGGLGGPCRGLGEIP